MRIKMIFIAVIFFTLFSIAVSFGSEKEAQKSPSAFFPANSYEFEQVVDGAEVMHDFIIQNKGTAPLIIEKVKTG
jgi:hypothetical protein